jgi:glycerol-3-phosphate dehydrogenase
MLIGTTAWQTRRYLPGVKLPDNIVADPDPIRTAEDATLLIFVLPHQFVNSLCHKLKGKLHHRAKAISLIKVSRALVGYTPMVVVAHCARVNAASMYDVVRVSCVLRARVCVCVSRRVG